MLHIVLVINEVFDEQKMTKGCLIFKVEFKKVYDFVS